jgi:aromatic-L-amino-acid decarboxylase
VSAAPTPPLPRSKPGAGYQRGLSLPPAQMRAAGRRMIDLVIERLGNLAAGPPHATATPQELHALLDEPLPQKPADLGSLVEFLAHQVLPVGWRPDHPRCFAFDPSIGNFPAVLAEALAAAFISVPGAWLVGAGPTQLELTTITWLCDLLGLPREHGGLFVSGGSVANLTALTVARDQKVPPGRLADARLYCSVHTHPSIAQAAHILGLQRSQLVVVPADENSRIDITTLTAAVQRDLHAGLVPFAVAATLGTTATGAADPLPPLADLCDQNGLWLHADGAHGAAAALTDRGRAQLAGLHRADSLVIDPHKWLFQPYEAGVVLLKEPCLLTETFTLRHHQVDTGYLQPARPTEGQVNLSDYGPQQSRGLRALKLWLSLKTFGAQAFRDAVDHGLDLSDYTAARIRSHPRLHLVTAPSLGILTFRYDTAAHATQPELHQQIGQQLLSEGQAMVFTTLVRGEAVLRMCTINPATTPDDIDRTLERIVQLADQYAVDPATSR